jgi:pyroglutamyl-peptidase
VAKRASCFEIETRAFNICGPRADQDGLKAGTYSVVRGGPAILPVTLPYDRLLRALRNAALPSALSRNPGRYICNLVLYRTLYAPASKTGAPSPSPPLPAAFIHIPALGVPDAPPNTLTQDILLEGAKILVSAAAQAVLREQDNGYEWRRW